ncbi:hypothetical protein HanXRQr2_Chr11g0466441 [Helianthus annuus]|uniref:Uncharacterized protein n=1 Tax=Helianthus annuus TaxID=4232 RepID=A0A9K3HKF0_HELAN|nr:hypothetical protein HanXRQr2_Chr11g0466441 [Helianthus annuus]
MIGVPKGYIKTAQIGFQLSSQNFESCRLSDSICSNQTENLPRPRDRQPVQFEGVGPITMSCIFIQIFW